MPFDDPAPRGPTQQAYTPEQYAPGTKHLGGYFNMGGLTNQGILEGFNAGQRPAPQAPLDSQFRSGQLQQIQQLRGIASGQQQGAGELAVQRQIANANAAQQAQARMARGGQNAALAYRGAANNTAGIGLAGAGQSQQAAMGDQMQAQGLLTGALGQGRGQDNQTQIANLDAQLRQMGMNDATRLAYINQMITIQQGSQARSDAANARDQQMMGNMISAGGTVAAGLVASDERVKTDVDDASRDIDDMLDRLHAKNYRYKDEAKHGAGPRAGILAQDMEASRAGARVVREVGGVKHLDVNAALSAALAATARLNQRLRVLEAK